MIIHHNLFQSHRAPINATHYPYAEKKVDNFCDKDNDGESEEDINDGSTAISGATYILVIALAGLRELLF